MCECGLESFAPVLCLQNWKSNRSKNQIVDMVQTLHPLPQKVCSSYICWKLISSSTGYRWCEMKWKTDCITILALVVCECISFGMSWIENGFVVAVVVLKHVHVKQLEYCFFISIRNTCSECGQPNGGTYKQVRFVFMTRNGFRSDYSMSITITAIIVMRA